ncbi:MAG: NADH-quinone oxidoreductase subunit NuoE [Deltaproteobacteria bacterium]|nr:NADH-quinone oxidoreductase subunit NuoE [Deltaproteobacteria bacterium]
MNTQSGDLSMNTQKITKNKIKGIIGRHEAEKTSLIAILQDMQNEFRYLPKEALVAVGKHLDMPLARVYEVATFYNAFSLKPRGRYLVEVCAGTACHVKGGFNLLAKLERELKIECGQTTKDGTFTLEQVRCLGCCSLAPVVRIDNDIHAYLTQDKIPRILKKYRK